MSIPPQAVWQADDRAKRQLLEHVNRVANAGMEVRDLAIGIARRDATYTRGDLVFRDLDRLSRSRPRSAASRSSMRAKPIRTIGAASAAQHPDIRGLIGVRAVASFAVLVLANLSVAVSAQPLCQGIHVNILNIRNSTGTVACALFESPDGFPTEFLRSATNVMLIKIRRARARCDFEDIPPGTYAVAVIHDENTNGKLDTNWLGIPTEGYGFSRDAKSLVGVPSFSAASFPYDGRNLDLTVRLHY